jgi:hypothetical protein
VDDFVWRQIEALLVTAHDRVIIVAPFIKDAVFQRTLEAVPTAVGSVVVITRWHVADVAAGVTDPEIIFRTRDGGQVAVLLHPRLHAKLYVADQRCLVGSANLTARALGLTEVSNIELLIPADVTQPEIADTLQRMLSEAQPATAELAQLVRDQANEMLDSEQLTVWSTDEPDAMLGRWYPTTRDPKRLFQIYQGERDRCPKTIVDAALLDLAMLGVTPGLDAAAFAAVVRQRLYDMPPVRRLADDGRLSTQDLENALMTDGVDSQEDAAEIARIIVGWLNEFDPDLQVIPRSFDLFRAKRLH